MHIVQIAAAKIIRYCIDNNINVTEKTRICDMAYMLVIILDNNQIIIHITPFNENSVQLAFSYQYPEETNFRYPVLGFEFFDIDLDDTTFTDMFKKTFNIVNQTIKTYRGAVCLAVGEK